MTSAEQIALSHGGAGCPWCFKGIEIGSTPSGRITCPHCGKQFDAICFQPPERKVVVEEVAHAGPDGATPCGNHPGNAATANCARCGTFICKLCEIESSNGIYCPGCYERLSADAASEAAVGKFKDYGSMAGGAAAAGCLIYFTCVLLGPLAIYYGFKGLKQKKEMQEIDGIWSIRVAMGVGLIETLVGFGAIIALVWAVGNAP